ncbi:YXWGXW repeat-containing protein [Mucilaginibacter sp.]
MKSLNLIILFLAITCGLCHAQGQVADTHPAAIIYIVDPQSGQEVLAQGDAAVLFKDAFVDLVSNTTHAKVSMAPGHKTLTITQMDPSAGNAYQLTLDTKIFGQTVNVYTFSYNVDQNTLYYFNKDAQNWEPELIQGYNVTNLNNCLAFSKFNEQAPSGPPVPAGIGQTANNDQQADADQSVQADNAPPVLQTDDQPECPVDGYLWQPGYWAFNPAGGYYWVHGTWVAPPQTGLLWTPPYWGYENGIYLFHHGYWGAEVGYYGGISYGYGYGGHGYYGGNWYGGHFRYNTAVVRVNVNVVHNTYVDRTVVETHPPARVSFNGPGGVNARPTPKELQVSTQNHIVDNRQNPKAFTPSRPVSDNNNILRGNNNNNARPGGMNNNANVQGGANNTAKPAGGNNNTTLQKGPNSNYTNGNANNNVPKVPVNPMGNRTPSVNNQQYSPNNRQQGVNTYGKKPSQPAKTYNSKAPAKSEDKKQ